MPVNCTGSSTATCSLTLTMTVVETIKGDKLIAVAAANGTRKARQRVVTVGSATLTLRGGQTGMVQVALNEAGKKLLAKRHTLIARLAVNQAGKTISTYPVAFKANSKRKH